MSTWDVCQAPWRDLTKGQVEEAIRCVLGFLLKDSTELFFEDHAAASSPIDMSILPRKEVDTALFF